MSLLVLGMMVTDILINCTGEFQLGSCLGFVALLTDNCKRLQLRTNLSWFRDVHTFTTNIPADVQYQGLDERVDYSLDANFWNLLTSGLQNAE